ncbi:MAG: B12-binding domain-containing radical SAM protein, partial [Candidatus Aminicenantes bacterium]|nr:B12-binding domain-containing radical SAM protein [Candidatus Aminicenantes bacterium]
MAKIIFIEPKSPNLHIFSVFKLPRLGIFILGNLMRQRGWDVEVYIEDMEPLEWKRIESADMIAISTISSTAPRSYVIADRARAKKIPVIMGGAHITFQAEEALEHSDFVIRGEGEKALMQFIDVWESRGDFRTVANLSFKSHGKIIHNPLSPFNPNLDEYPVPDFSLYSGRTDIVSKDKTIPVQTSRGCPFNCSFCSVTPMFGQRYRFRSVENIINELKEYQHQSQNIFFYDDNFAANPKHTRILLQAMITEKFKFRWSAQVRADITKDPELVKLMKKAGCHTLYIGFESINPATLEHFKKNQSPEDVREAIRVFHKNNISIHGMFMFGSDEDHESVFNQTASFCRKHHLNSVQFMILTPLPGTAFFHRMGREGRLLHRMWQYYDGMHTVFRPLNFSPFALQDGAMGAFQDFYSYLGIMN